MEEQEQAGSQQTDGGNDNEFPGYPQYPPSEDIYQQGHKEADIDPENVNAKKIPDLADTNDLAEELNAGDLPGADLDIPGAELDDDLEAAGSEDEENNYYSIGGDNHENLEEDNQ